MKYDSKKKMKKVDLFPFHTKNQIQGVPENMGIQWKIRYRLCYELAL